MDDRIDTAPLHPDATEPSADALKSAFDAQFTALLGAPAAASPSVDAEFGARRALELATLARGPRVADKLALLPDALFAAGQVDTLDGLAQATLYVDALHRASPAPEADRADKLSDTLLEEAEAVRATLHKLLDYHFGDDAAIAAELAEMRARRGAFRVAATLARLATLARGRMELLSKDTKYWRADLLTDADRLADLVKAAVANLSERDALELKRRAYGLLEAAFAEVRHAVAFVMRHSPDLVETLPVMKKPPQRKPKADAT